MLLMEVKVWLWGFEVELGNEAEARTGREGKARSLAFT